MKTWKMLALISFVASPALASQQKVEQCMTVFKNSVGGCSQADQNEGRCEVSNDKAVCMTYENSCAEVLSCNLKAAAIFEENETSFTKEVFDRRSEKVFALQQQRFCFNFAKDEYFLWKLKKVAKPTIDCEGANTNKTPCDPAQSSSCGVTPPVDSAPCSPYDFTCS